MPLTKSAKKALKVDKRRKEENDVVRAKIKNAVKGAKLSIINSKNDIKTKMQELYRELDIAAKKNVIHKNKASRLKSRITKLEGKYAEGAGKTETKVTKKAKTAKKTTKKK